MVIGIKKKLCDEEKQAPVRVLARYVVSLLILVLLTGCAKNLYHAVKNHEGKAVLIDGVPFFPQSRYQCGPASLAAVLNFYGDLIRPETISNEIYRQDIRGTVSLDLVLFARQHGFDARWFQGELRSIKTAIDKGKPIIVMVDKGIGFIRAYHFMVVIGYGEEVIIVNSGKSMAKQILWKTFSTEWKKTQNWMMLVTPKSMSLEDDKES